MQKTMAAWSGQMMSKSMENDRTINKYIKKISSLIIPVFKEMGQLIFLLILFSLIMIFFALIQEVLFI